MPPPPTPTPTRTRRLVALLLYVGCGGAAVLMLRPVLSAQPAPAVVPVEPRSPTDLDPFPLPPGDWSLLSEDRLGDLVRRVKGEAVPARPPVPCPLLPPGVEPLAQRLDPAGRVSAFLTADVERAAVERHWKDTGWTLTATDNGTALRRGAERAFAWAFAATQPGRVRLLVTVKPDPQPEARP
jgi:hypothetical protein